VQLVVMLYDAALKHCRLGRDAVREGRLAVQHEHLTKAQQILSELSCSLDMDRGGEIAKNLFGLYTFCTNELARANVEDSTEPILAVEQVLAELREAWQAIAKPQGEEERIAA
jgi:flagellar protein FliS